ncbi:MAG: hypothetical protein ABI140_18430 [Jatrophihabitantaceae bacterium]
MPANAAGSPTLMNCGVYGVGLGVGRGRGAGVLCRTGSRAGAGVCTVGVVTGTGTWLLPGAVPELPSLVAGAGVAVRAGFGRTVLALGGWVIARVAGAELVAALLVVGELLNRGEVAGSPVAAACRLSWCPTIVPMTAIRAASPLAAMASRRRRVRGPVGSGAGVVGVSSVLIWGPSMGVGISWCLFGGAGRR